MMRTQMNFSLVDENGQKVIEGVPDDAPMTGVRDIDRVIEACYSEDASAALLYART